jgi:phosphoglycolate phosphatase-like HAD superfamily hydrolase
MEILNKTYNRGRFKHVLFDFDGTISLIRAGWQDIMKPYFVEVLAATPKAESRPEIERVINELVDLTTGKQTIYQCMDLASEVEGRGATPPEAIVYKEEYNRRLLEKIGGRIENLRNGSVLPDAMVVPGSHELLKALREKGMTLYLASGTDEQYVFNEAKLVGVDGYFNGGIWGARDDFKTFSKKMVIQKIMTDFQLKGEELLGFGDGFVEIENVKEAGGFAVGVASNELERGGQNEWKRKRLASAGADVIIPNFEDLTELIDYLFSA